MRHASIERGVVRLIVPATAHEVVAPLVRCLASHASVLGERLPRAAWEALPAVTDRLSRGVRAAFDPHQILNPGLLAPMA